MAHSMGMVPVLVMIAMVGICTAHVCMYSPTQRGGYDLTFPGARQCFRKQGPCGINVAGAATTSLQGGRPFTVQFQQNLNHFTVANPGRLDAAIALVANPREEDFKPFGDAVADYNAYNMITQTNFSITGMVPNVDIASAVIRIRYVSNNPKEAEPNGTNFYNCADVSIHSTKVDVVEPSEHSKAMTGPGANPCCTVKQWTANTYQTGSWRAPTTGFIGYDAVNALMRIDTTVGNGQGGTVYDGSYRMYLNFTSGLQWFVDVNNKQCYGYHLDVWQDWCYGSSQLQKFVKNQRLGDTTLDIWSNGEFYFGSSHDTCTPTSLARNGDVTLYTDFSPSVDPALFVPEPLCKTLLKGTDTNMVPSEFKDVITTMMAGVPKRF